MDGAVQQHQPRVAPALSEPTELRLAPARIVGNGYFRHRELGPSGIDDHLACELHAGRSQAHAAVGILGEGPEAGVGIGALQTEEEVQQSRERRIADVAVEPGHGPRHDSALETRTEDVVVPLTKLLDQLADLSEVV